MRGQGSQLGTLGWVAVALACMAGLGMSGDPGSSTPSPEGGQTVQRDRQTEPSKRAKPKMSGLVIDHTATGLVVLPWKDGAPTTVKATSRQRNRCPVDSRYPDCL